MINFIYSATKLFTVASYARHCYIEDITVTKTDEVLAFVGAACWWIMLTGLRRKEKGKWVLFYWRTGSKKTSKPGCYADNMWNHSVEAESLHQVSWEAVPIWPQNTFAFGGERCQTARWAPMGWSKHPSPSWGRKPAIQSHVTNVLSVIGTLHHCPLFNGLCSTCTQCLLLWGSVS